MQFEDNSLADLCELRGSVVIDLPVVCEPGR